MLIQWTVKSKETRSSFTWPLQPLARKNVEGGRCMDNTGCSCWKIGVDHQPQIVRAKREATDQCLSDEVQQGYTYRIMDIFVTVLVFAFLQYDEISDSSFVVEMSDLKGINSLLMRSISLEINYTKLSNLQQEGMERSM